MGAYSHAIATRFNGYGPGAMVTVAGFAADVDMSIFGTMKGEAVCLSSFCKYSITRHGLRRPLDMGVGSARFVAIKAG